MSKLPDNIRKMWEEAALSSHEKHISGFHAAARKQGRELTDAEKAAINRHRQNAINAEKKAAEQREAREQK